MSYKYNPLLVGKLDLVGAGASRLSELDDVNTAGTVNGKVLTFQSGTWLPETVAGGGDMLISQYVTGAGTVYNASRLEGETLATVQAHNVAASKVTTGTFGLARIPTMDDAHIPNVEGLGYGGAFAEGQIPNLPTTKITSGTLGLARIPGTLTGKDADKVDGADAGVVANTVFKIPAGIAQGDIFHVNSGGSVVNLSAGTSGHFLKTLGAGTNPAWESVPGGGDMLKNVYDTGDNGIVDNSERLETKTLATVQAHNVAASKVTTGTFGLARIPTMDDAHIPNVEGLGYGGAFAEGQIPNLPTTKITSGTFNANRIPALPTARITTGTFGLARIPTMDDAHIPDLDTLSYSGAFAEAQIPNLPTTKITSGTLGIARIPSITNAYLAGEITSDKIPALSGTALAYPLDADSVGTTQIEAAGVGNDELAASGLDISKCTVGTAGASRIPALPTSRITTGTFNLNRIPAVDDARIPNLETLSYGGAFAEGQIPNLPTTKITSGTFNANRIPALPTARITTGTFGLARIPTMDDAHIPDLDTLSYGAAFATAQIPAIGAYKTASGTLNADRIPVLPTARYGSAVLVSGTRSMTNAFRLKSNAGTTGMATVDGAIFFDTTADKVKVYVA